MSVKTQHPEYTAMLNRWTRCRDTADGQDAVHAAGSTYLPVLKDQTTEEYNSYKMRATFYNATWRTIAGLQGMLFRKPATIDVPDTITPLLKDVTMTGESLYLFAMETVEECLTVGRIGVFVDYPVIDLLSMTAADAMAQNLRPMLKSYVAESIINWKTGLVNNAITLTMVVLIEAKDVKVDEFLSEIKIQYRVLDLAVVEGDATNTLQYRVRVIEHDDKTNMDILISQVYPIINGKPLNFIPFYFISADSIDPEVDAPPLIDLVDINLSHYRTNADYEHGCHFTGLPTPIISGYTPTNEGESFYIGSTKAWVFPRPEAKATFLEFTGTGLKALQENLDRKEMQMAILGARMLEGQQNRGQSENTTTLNLGGEQSMLSAMSEAVSMGLERALQTFSLFANATSTPIKYRLNKDFFPMPMSALSLTALVASWQNGAISYETLFDNLKRGEIIDIDQTITQELAKMDQHKPVIPGGTKVNQSSTGGQETTMPTQRQLQTP
jgi:hypothetical protein